MKHITIVDAMMGRGKTSAAIRYMNQNKDTKSFLYVTPYLDEVGRVCDTCDFDEPNIENVAKSIQLKSLLRKKRNIVATHKLFTIMDEEAMELAEQNGYCLIVDESLPVIDGVKVSPSDMQLMLSNLIKVNDDCSVTWIDEEYSGKLDGYKEIASKDVLYYHNKSLFHVLNPRKFAPYKEIIFLTYLFQDQLIRAYLDYFGFTYNIIGVERDESGFRFSDRPDEPPPIDYRSMIHIVGLDEQLKDDKMNEVGDRRTALSVQWFNDRGRGNAKVRKLKNNMRNFFDRKVGCGADRRLWTCYEEKKEWLYGPQNRFASNFLALNARATNNYRGADSVAYLVNRFVNPNVINFFADKGISIDQDGFALAEMIQWIWRSAIRDNKEINLYIPSRRMRGLLLDWLDKVSQKEKR